MAILSANSRRNLSAGSSSTNTEFSDELFDDVASNVHGFKPIRPVVVVEDRTGTEYQRETRDETIEEEIASFSEEQEVQPEVPAPEVESNCSDNYSNGRRIEDNYTVVSEEAISQNPEEDGLEKIVPVIEEVDDFTGTGNEENSRQNMGTEFRIEEISNDFYVKSGITTDLDAKTPSDSCLGDMTRKQSFSSFVSLEITETGTIEVSSNLDVEESLRIEKTKKIDDNEVINEEEVTKQDDREAKLMIFEDEILDSGNITEDRDDTEKRHVTSRTPVITKAWCKTNNPILVGVLLRWLFVNFLSVELSF